MHERIIDGEKIKCLGEIGTNNKFLILINKKFIKKTDALKYAELLKAEGLNELCSIYNKDFYYIVADCSFDNIADALEVADSFNTTFINAVDDYERIADVIEKAVFFGDNIKPKHL